MAKNEQESQEDDLFGSGEYSEEEIKEEKPKKETPIEDEYEIDTKEDDKEPLVDEE